jgi:hypothetical protein
LLSPVNSFEQHVAARLLEFFRPSIHWNRALWNIGTVLAIREVLEASEAHRAGILGPDSLQAAIDAALRLVGQDPTVNKAAKQTLQQSLNKAGSRSQLRFEGLEYRIAAGLAKQLEAGYLAAWAQVIAQGPDGVGPERTARAIASHLLDMGFSPGFLHRWWTFQIKHDPAESRLSMMLESIAARADQPRRPFDVLIAFPSKLAASKKKGFTVPDRWLEASQVSAWLVRNHFSIEGVKQQGGLLLTVTEHDAEAAAASAAEIVDVFAARVLVSLNKEIRPLPNAWVASAPSPISISRASRGVHVGAVHRENRVWLETEKDDAVDPAIELLAPLQSSSPAAAVAGGWAAIESLLSEPDNRAAAADRLARIVACSFPRAELTMLSYALEKSGGPLAGQLKRLPENRDRAALVAEAIAGGNTPNTLDPSEQAAVERMKAVLANPSSKLADVQLHAADAFRRLYRQRNLVLHGGKTSAIALRASLRTAAPLVGAGVDRIVHARYVEALHPLELAARATVALGVVGSTPSDCVDLLGRATR